MATTAFSARAPEANGRGPWTVHDWYESFLFLVQAFVIVCGGVLLYTLGPAIGIAVLVGGLTAWSVIGNHPGSAKKEPAVDEDCSRTQAKSPDVSAVPTMPPTLRKRARGSESYRRIRLIRFTHSRRTA